MYRAERSEGGKWDNCNSIINKIYFLKKDKILVVGYIMAPKKNMSMS